MKTKLFFIFFLLIPSLAGYSQQGRGWEEKRELIKAEKIAFFTEKMELTPHEAEKFWPIYNDHQNRKDKIHEEIRNDMKYVRMNIENMSEDELNAYADRHIDYHKKLVALAEEYHKKYKAILPAKKIIILYQTENSFKEHLLQRIKGQEKGPGTEFAPAPENEQNPE